MPKQEPNAERFPHPLIGAQKHLRRGKRRILARRTAKPSDIEAMPNEIEGIQAVRASWGCSKGKTTLVTAAVPTGYSVEVISSAPFLVVPEASSERLAYVPIAWMQSPVIPGNLVRLVENASLSRSRC